MFKPIPFIRLFFKVIKICLFSILSTLCFNTFAQTNDSVSLLQPKNLKEITFQRERFQFKKLYVPSALIVTGIALNGNKEESFKNEIVEERNEHIPDFKFHADDYLQYSPIAIAYGLDALGIKSKTDLSNRTVILIKSELGMLFITHLLKNTIRSERPDYSGNNSFPSGHTAQAFAAATFLSEEYKYRFNWMPYLSYSIASSVGILRMANNKHYISDVLVGAGIGILSTKIAYWTHQYKWGKKKIVKFTNY